MRRNPRIFVVGSYVHAFTIEAPHMPADGETVIALRSEGGPGGKGSNQAIQAARLGADVEILACVGADAFGASARELWAGEGIGTDLVRTEPDHSTGLAFIVLDERGQNRILVDVGANGSLGAADAARAEESIATADLVLAQFEPPVEVVAEAFLIARRHGVPTLLNPAPARTVDDELLGLVDVLTPNLSEAATLSGLPGADPGRAAVRLRERGPGTIVVTLEEQGAHILDGFGARRVPGVPVEVVDSTGAGDAFTGALAVALAGRAGVDRAVELANRAGAFCVTRRGVVPGLGSRADLPALRE